MGSAKGGQGARQQDPETTMTFSHANGSLTNRSGHMGQPNGQPTSARRPASRAMIVGMAGFVLTGALSGCVHHRKQHVVAELAPSNVTSIGVNSYLWHASLDALSFMPLVQADSAGGVIVTDWYTNPANPGERMKITVTILDRDLRSDALRVAASRQVSQSGTWVDAPVQAATVQRLEDVILTKARDLRRSAVAG
jgi:hypothetical protein